jgi:hypothetical protein
MLGKPVLRVPLLAEQGYQLEVDRLRQKIEEDRGAWGHPKLLVVNSPHNPTGTMLSPEQGVPSGPVYTAEDVFSDPHISAREMLVEVNDPVASLRKCARTPLHLSAAPNIPTVAAPRLGEQTLPILRDLLGLDREVIERCPLRAW